MHTEQKTQRIPIEKLWVYNLPAGHAFRILSHLSQEPQTTQGITQAQEQLNQNGLLILDAHRNAIDIMAVAAALTQNLPIEQLVGPVAGKWYDSPKAGVFFRQVEKIPGLVLLPVYREEEKSIIDRSGLTAQQKSARNDKYKQTVKEALALSHHIAIVAPYGSRQRFGTEVRKGVREIIKQTAPATLVTQAIFRRLPLPHFAIYVSENLIHFSQNSTDTEIQETITTEFTKLQRRIES